MHHELWLDEAHHWLLARDSVSMLDLFKNTRYEGHPILWNILLFGITRCTLNPFWMQFLHILISTSVVFIFLRKAPFSFVFKTLFIFGYFMLFEYNVISRNYILGVLFLFLTCSVFKDRNTKFTLLCVYLAIAANSHMMFVIISFAVFLTLLLEQFQNKNLFNKTNLVGYFIFVIGITIAIFQIIPPSDTLFFDHVNQMTFTEKFTKGFISLFKGLITIPDFRTIHFWNSNFLVNLSKPITAFIGLLIYIIPLLLFKNRKIIFFFYIGLVGTNLFFFFTQMSATRYDGINYILFIIALWIEKFYTSENYKIKGFLNSLQLTLFKKPIIYSILITQLFSGIYAYSMDFKYQFASANATVNYLKEKKLNAKEIISITCDGTTISPYLEKKVWFLSDGGYESYCHWNYTSVSNFSQKNCIDMVSSYLKTHNDAIYVSYYSISDKIKTSNWQQLNDTIKIRFLKKYDNAIIANSSYSIFEVARITKLIK